MYNTKCSCISELARDKEGQISQSLLIQCLREYERKAIIIEHKIYHVLFIGAIIFNQMYFCSKGNENINPTKKA